MKTILISQLVDKIEDYSKSLIMQKPQAQLNVQVIWLEKALFAIQGRMMGDANFQAAVGEMFEAVSRSLEAQEAKNEGQVRPKAYN